MRTARLETVHASIQSPQPDVAPGGWGIAPQMNKFEQVSSVTSGGG